MAVVPTAVKRPRTELVAAAQSQQLVAMVRRVIYSILATKYLLEANKTHSYSLSLALAHLPNVFWSALTDSHYVWFLNGTRLLGKRIILKITLKLSINSKVLKTEFPFHRDKHYVDLLLHSCWRFRNTFLNQMDELPRYENALIHGLADSGTVANLNNDNNNNKS